MRPLRLLWPALGAVLLGCFALRLAMLVYVSPRPLKLFTPDSFGYDQLALNLLHNGVFSSNAQPPFNPDLKRTPGYPVMMAAIYLLAGHIPEVVVLVQLLLAVATACLTFVLARELGMPRGAGLLAALLLSMDPVSAMTSVTLLTETLFTALLTAAILTLVLWWRRGGTAWLLLAAVLFGVGALTRPVAQFLPIVIAPTVALVSSRAGWRQAGVAVALFLAVSMGITYSWAYRNYVAGGEFSLSTIADTNLIYYRAREVLASVDGISQEEARLRLQQRIPANTSPAEMAAAERREALSVLLEHPRETAYMLVGGIVRTFADPGFTTTCTLLDTQSTSTECFPGEASMNEGGAVRQAVGRFAQMTLLQQAVLLWSLVLSAAVYLAALLGTLALARARLWAQLEFLMVPMGYLVLLSAGAEAYSRFRVPLVPELALLGAFGVGALLERLRGREPTAETQTQRA